MDLRRAASGCSTGDDGPRNAENSGAGFGIGRLRHGGFVRQPLDRNVEVKTVQIRNEWSSAGRLGPEWFSAGQHQ